MPPTYEYQCPKCNVFTDVVKPMADSSSEESCPGCTTIMERVITSPRIATSNCQFDTHYNWGLGKVVKSKNDIKNELHRINGETGKNIVEVGNDNMKSIKKQRKAYTLD